MKTKLGIDWLMYVVLAWFNLVHVELAYLTLVLPHGRL